MAAFMKNASNTGAGPLIVMLTEVLGCTDQSRCIVFRIVNRGNTNAAVTHLAINIGAMPGIFSIKV